MGIDILVSFIIGIILGMIILACAIGVSGWINLSEEKIISHQIEMGLTKDLRDLEQKKYIVLKNKGGEKK